jgi:fructosamine-3-kinase
VIDAGTRAAIETALGSRILRAASVSGGDINAAYRLDLDDGRRVFAKTNDRADPAMFPAEARGLAWLAEARALRTPEVIAVSSGRPGEPSFLVLELIESSSSARGFDEACGRGLAALHRFGAPSFGLDHDNFIGPLPQSNRACARWADFFREARLVPQLELAKRHGRADAALERSFDRLISRLDDLVGPDEPPARLHGDLWGGNLYVGDAGEPCLIDPACYGGHREIELAMMRLFGGFSERVFAAYAEHFPLAPGHADRVELYQLYPLMVHLNLFGAGYLSGVKNALGRYV